MMKKKIIQKEKIRKSNSYLLKEYGWNSSVKVEQEKQVNYRNKILPFNTKLYKQQNNIPKINDIMTRINFYFANEYKKKEIDRCLSPFFKIDEPLQGNKTFLTSGKNEKKIKQNNFPFLEYVKETDKFYKKNKDKMFKSINLSSVNNSNHNDDNINVHYYLEKKIINIKTNRNKKFQEVYNELQKQTSKKILYLIYKDAIIPLNKTFKDVNVNDEDNILVVVEYSLDNKINKQ